MSDLSVNVAWREILRETEAGNIPHCRAISANPEWHNEIIHKLAEIILGGFRLSHPDLLIAGSLEKAPDIDTCRNLINDIALKPLEAKKRLGVIMCADKLLLPAANSLLKLSEEPPEHAYLLFLMSDGRLFLPTLKSRSRFNVLISDDKTDSSKMPENDSEWVQWLSDSRKADVDGILKNLEAWSNFEINEKNFALAEKIEKIKIAANKKNLSVPLLCDIILLILRKSDFNSREENINFEYIFNDIW